MFSFLGKESCAVQVYGKLPLAKDYLRVGAGSGSGQALRDWLDRAFSQGASTKTPLALPWPAALIAGESWGAPLCGAAWPSGDAGNLRPFPFVAFVERKKKALHEDLLHGLPVSSPVFDWLAEAYAARDSESDGASFLAAMRKREIAIDKLVPFEAERVDFDAWLSGLWPEQGKDGLLELLRGLEALRRSSYRGPLRLPLVGNLPTRPQVTAWFRLLVEMNLVGRDALPTVIFPLPAKGPAQPVPEEPKPETSEEGSSESSDDSSGMSSYESEPSIEEPSPEPSVDEESSSDATGDSSAGSIEVPTEPVFLVVFRATPVAMDATWLRPLAPKEARKPGDFCGTEPANASASDPAPEGAPALADSLLGAFAGLRGRLAK
ncbi:MAG TPA: hypothetical protein VM509_07380 [Planctomycetota bacterium]|nr:hypothetical protein [Planctomycetota bacterium]